MNEANRQIDLLASVPHGIDDAVLVYLDRQCLGLMTPAAFRILAAGLASTTQSHLIEFADDSIAAVYDGKIQQLAGYRLPS